MFQLSKFVPNDNKTIFIRSEILPKGKIVVFGVAATDLSSLEPGNNVIDFDAESEIILKEVQDPKTNLAYKYEVDIGFIEIDTRAQKWFVF